MKKGLKRGLIGMLAGFMVVGAISSASGGVRIVVDNKEIFPTDVSGNRVDPIIIDGTTYLPVRAVANAFDKPVYWDGETGTVYLGEHSGDLPYPTLKLSDATNIGNSIYNASSKELKDNYDHYYGEAMRFGENRTAQYLLNGKYSRFKGTIYVQNGTTRDGSGSIIIEADGKNIYTSPEITKSSKPIDVDVSIKGCNDFKIKTARGFYYLFIGDAGFYQ